MDIINKLENDYTQAFKNKNELVILVLRGLKTAITNAEIAKSRQALSELEIIKLFKTEVKRRKDAVLMYEKGNRQDLADKEKSEIEIISQYLPAEMGEDEIKIKVIEVIKKMGTTSQADAGKVIGAVMKELGSVADGSLVGQIVREELSK